MIFADFLMFLEPRIFVGRTPPPLDNALWQGEGSKGESSKAGNSRGGEPSWRGEGSRARRTTFPAPQQVQPDATFPDLSGIYPEDARIAALTMEIKLAMARRLILEEHLERMFVDLRELVGELSPRT
jgi:hypothetical protein